MHTDTDSPCSAEPSQWTGAQELWMTKVTLGIWFVLLICDPAFARREKLIQQEADKGCLVPHCTACDQYIGYEICWHADYS